MKDILVLAARKPYPLDDGWKIRTFFLIKALSELGASVDLLVFDETDGAVSCKELEHLCRQVVVIPRQKQYALSDLLRGLFFPTPFSVQNYADNAYAQAYADLIIRNEYGYIQVEDIVLAQYVVNTTGVRKVLDMHNVESDLLYRYASQSRHILKKIYAVLTAKKLSRYELQLSNCFDSVLVCSSEDKNTLMGKKMTVDINVIPNGVDCSYYGAVTRSKSGNAIIFVGSMDYHANISGILFFATEVLPLIRTAHKDLKLYIVGKNPSVEISALGDNDIVVTGTVDDVRPYLEKAKVSVVPLLVGGGTRLKILEAMAAGLPVVSTSLGAEGLAVRHGEHLLIADSASEFALQVVRLLDHSEECARLADNGKQFVMTAYDWSVVMAQLKVRVNDLLGSAS